MDIAQFRIARNAAEERIRQMIADEKARLEAASGIEVTGLSVTFMQVTTFGDDRPKYAIGQVEMSCDV